MNDVINMIKNMDRVSTSLIQRRLRLATIEPHVFWTH